LGDAASRRRPRLRCSGGHVHWNWGNNQFRKLILNAIVWTAALTSRLTEFPPAKSRSMTCSKITTTDPRDFNEKQRPPSSDARRMNGK